ncbi:hypothetical protein [Streptomyces sp. NBC_01340]
MLTEALTAIAPETARILAAIPAATAILRRRLSLQPEAVVAVPPSRSGRTRRRGLGPGWKGMNAAR